MARRGKGGRRPPTYGRSGKGDSKKGATGGVRGRKVSSGRKSTKVRVEKVGYGTNPIDPGTKTPQRPKSRIKVGIGKTTTPSTRVKGRVHGYRARITRQSNTALRGDYPGGDRPILRVVGHPSRPKSLSASVKIVEFNPNKKKDKRNLAAKPGIAYTFKRKDIIRLYESCPEFAKIAESGRYFYYDGRIILFHPKCAKVGDDVHSLVISKAVYRHPSQYCLKVVTEADGTINVIHAKQYEALSTSGYSDPLYLDADQGGYLFTLSAKKGSGKKPSSSKSGKSSGQSGAEGDDGSDLPPINIIKLIIDAHLDRMHISLRKFALFIELNEETIRRLYTRPESETKLSNVVAVCLGLHMEPQVSEVVLHLSGHYLKNTPEENAYTHLLFFRYKDSIEQCNHYLIDHNFTALTTKL